MKKVFLVLIILIAAGCTNHFENDEVVAIVGEKEITYADVRMIYNLEEIELSEAVNYYVKEEIMVQEAKKMGVDVSAKVDELKELNMPFPVYQTKPQSKYAKETAEQLGMTEEAFYEKYLDLSTTRSAYIMRFIEENAGELTEDEDASEYAEKVDELVDSLMATYSDEVQIFVE